MSAVRDALPDDAAAIAEVQVASWQVAYRGLIADEVLDGLSIVASRDRWTAILTSPPPRTAALILDGDGIDGFVSVGPRLGGDGTVDDGQLYAIYLQPGRWGRGLGGILHRAALDRLRALGFTSATLWVLDGNERAIGFYRHGGWRLDGATQMDTGPRGVILPELRMARSLTRAPE